MKFVAQPPAPLNTRSRAALAGYHVSSIQWLLRFTLEASGVNEPSRSVAEESMSLTGKIVGYDPGVETANMVLPR